MQSGSLQTQDISLPVSAGTPETVESESDLLQWLIADGMTGSSASTAAVGDASKGRRWLSVRDTGSPPELIRLWLNLKPGDSNSLLHIKRRIARDIARIYQLLSAQLNVILHSPQFQ